jgi:hypothetical protein
LQNEAGLSGRIAFGREAEDGAATQALSAPANQNVNTNSSPSGLKITDLRYAIVVKPGPSPCVLIRNRGTTRSTVSKRSAAAPSTQLLAATGKTETELH